MVGGFPVGQTRKVYGGQVAAGMRLLESTFVETHSVHTIDTSQISNPPPSFLIRLLLACKRLLIFFRNVLLQRPDVAIIFLADGASAIEKGVMVRIACAFNVPVMIFPRAGSLIRSYFSNRLFAAFVRNTLGRSDMFLCQGISFQKFAVQELGYSEESAPIIPNWTASEEHLQIGTHRNYQQNYTWPKVLFLGWLEEFKGVFDLLEAARILRGKAVDFHLTFGGDGAALPKARQFVEQHQLGEYITFAGWVDEEEKSDLLRSSDIFVLPSWSEGLPNAMIEAMSAGLSCVVTNVGMIPDYVVDGRDALVIKPHDQIGLVKALKTLILDQSHRESISKNGLHLARSQFSLENGASLLTAAVEQVCNCRK